MKRIAFYGGSFNPPHVGHQATVLYALETANVGKVVVVPVYQHPYGKQLEGFNERISMCHAMIYRFNGGAYDCQAHVSRIEETAFLRGGKGFTSETLKLFREEEKMTEDDQIVLVMGSDLRDDIHTWAGYDYLKAEVEACRLEFFFVERAGDISSTKVRQFIREEKSYRRLVPARVHEFIESRKLYR